MDLYLVGKFTHIAAAIVLVGSFLAAPVVHGAIRGAADVRALRALARLQRRIVAASGPAAALVLASGVYMTFSGWSFTTAWILVALGLFVANGAMAMSVVDPQVKRLLTAAEERSEGPLDQPLRDLVHEGKVVGAMRMIVGLDVAIVSLMVFKPGTIGSIAVAASGLALGSGLAVVAAWRARQAAPQVAVT